MMETTKLASAYSRIISGNSNIWEAFPEEKKSVNFQNHYATVLLKYEITILLVLTTF